MESAPEVKLQSFPGLLKGMPWCIEFGFCICASPLNFSFELELEVLFSLQMTKVKLELYCCHWRQKFLNVSNTHNQKIHYWEDHSVKPFHRFVFYFDYKPNRKHIIS